MSCKEDANVLMAEKSGEKSKEIGYETNSVNNINPGEWLLKRK